MFELVRVDSLPENANYRDTGCDLYPACLSCPLPRCRYDRRSGVRGLRNEFRDARIRRLRRQGKSVARIMAEVNVSRRTVYRVLALANQERAA